MLVKWTSKAREPSVPPPSVGRWYLSSRGSRPRESKLHLFTSASQCIVLKFLTGQDYQDSMCLLIEQMTRNANKVSRQDKVLNTSVWRKNYCNAGENMPVEKSPLVRWRMAVAPSVTCSLLIIRHHFLYLCEHASLFSYLFGVLNEAVAYRTTYSKCFFVSFVWMTQHSAETLIQC